MVVLFRWVRIGTSLTSAKLLRCTMGGSIVESPSAATTGIFNVNIRSARSSGWGEFDEALAANRGTPSVSMESHHMLVCTSTTEGHNLFLYKHIVCVYGAGSPSVTALAICSVKLPYSWVSINSLHREISSSPSSSTKERVYIAS